MHMKTMEKLYSVKQIIELTGYSQATIYRYIDSGILPVIKIRGGLRVRESDLCKMINENTEHRGTQKRSWRVRIAK